MDDGGDGGGLKRLWLPQKQNGCLPCHTCHNKGSRRSHKPCIGLHVLEPTRDTHRVPSGVNWWKGAFIGLLQVCMQLCNMACKQNKSGWGGVGTLTGSCSTDSPATSLNAVPPLNTHSMGPSCGTCGPPGIIRDASIAACPISWPSPPVTDPGPSSHVYQGDADITVTMK